METVSSTAMLPLAVHLIPYDGIGGVESAARSIVSGVYQGLRLHKCFLSSYSVSQAQCTEDHVGR